MEDAGAGLTSYLRSSADSDSCSSAFSIGASETPMSAGSQLAAPWNAATPIGCLTSMSPSGSGKSTSSRHSIVSARLVADLGDLVASYDYLLPLDFPLRRFFAQYRDRNQVDLTVGFTPAVNLPNVVVLYDPDGAVHIVGDEALCPQSRRAPGLGLSGLGSPGQRREVRPKVVLLGSSGPAP